MANEREPTEARIPDRVRALFHREAAQHIKTAEYRALKRIFAPPFKQDPEHEVFGPSAGGEFTGNTTFFETGDPFSFAGEESESSKRKRRRFLPRG